MVHSWVLQENGERVDGQWVQLEHDEEMGPMRGMYGTLEAGLEVHRNVKRAVLTAFACLLKKVGIIMMGCGKER